MKTKTLLYFLFGLYLISFVIEVVWLASGLPPVAPTRVERTIDMCVDLVLLTIITSCLTKPKE